MNTNSFHDIFTNRQDYIDYLKKLISSKKHIVFYGCGNIYPSVLTCWRKFINRNIDYVCDKNPAYWGATLSGVKCIAPADLIKIKDESIVFITAGMLHEIYDSLVNLGINNCYPIYDYDIYSGCMEEYNSSAVHSKIIQVYDMLEDAKSKCVLKKIMIRIFKGSSDPKLMHSICEDNQYFAPDIIHLSQHESFVDVGAYDGDTVVEFLKRTNGKFDNIYAFELCKDNFDTLQIAVSALPGNDHIHCFNMGCWDFKKDVKYSIALSSSTIGGGETIGYVDKLDSMLSDTPVTFIKMDIEGAEMNALRGAENIIRLQKPKLAICIYHDLRHFYEVPLYLKSLVPEYKIYIRHHTNSCYETVCYATL